ncbi:MAG: L,D-transpeptidase family protein [Phycisphaerales bacterium]|jgi:lipoprotein-anchoring transpeptidase ErfK/SrfK
MSLPSQGGIGFGGATRGRSRRGRGGGGRKLIAAIVVVALGGGLVWALTSGPSEGEAGDPATTEVAREPASPASRTPASTTPAAQRRQPDTRLVSAPPQAEEQATTEPRGRSVQTPARDTTLADRSTPEPRGVLATPGQDGSVVVGPASAANPSAAVSTLIQRAEKAIRENNPIAAREHYNAALMHDRASASDRAMIREQMQALNEDLIFSPRVYPGDPFSTTYTVQSGDVLSRIAHDQGVATEWLLIKRVNRLSKAGSIFEGQKLKLVRGPFHAVVSKTAFRMDVYIGPPEDTDQWVYVRSFPVGLGEFDGTPVGAFTVRRHSKLIDPFWRNPRTGEEFAASNPDNPIGEHWIGLEGLGQAETYSGYGIHGTIDPDSIGKEMSMGCVRMLPDDVALVYELLSEQLSQIHIVE